MTHPLIDKANAMQVELTTEQLAQAIILLARSCASVTGTDVYKDICEIIYPDCTKEWK